VRGEIYEARADGASASHRLLFTEEGAKRRVLLGLQAIELATRRLADWRRSATAS
jgi:hypothetical protein